MSTVQSARATMQTDICFNGLYCESDDPACRRDIPWFDVRIREAINRAINREEMLEVLFPGGGAELLPRYAMVRGERGLRSDADRALRRRVRVRPGDRQATDVACRLPGRVRRSRDSARAHVGRRPAGDPGADGAGPPVPDGGQVPGRDRGDRPRPGSARSAGPGSSTTSIPSATLRPGRRRSPSARSTRTPAARTRVGRTTGPARASPR